jgi:hypothetical protein
MSHSSKRQGKNVNILVRNKTLGKVGVDGRILKWTLKKYDMKAWFRRIVGVY